MHRSLMLWPAAFLAATVLTACGSEEPDQSDTDASPPEESSSVEATPDSTSGGTTSDDMPSTEAPSGDMGSATSGGAAMETTVATADTDLGTILVDGEGMTLYLFTKDSPNTSVCMDDCLVAWPILEGEPAAGDGADDSLLGSFERADGTVQATYDGWPLYYFAQDKAPGDVTGQAVNDVWWVIDADGAAITGAPGDDASGGFDY
jgi:predicted lipoprotein with Yx(FWY)xxD motif